MHVITVDGQPVETVAGRELFRCRCISCGQEATSMRGLLTAGQRLTYNQPLPLPLEPAS